MFEIPYTEQAQVGMANGANMLSEDKGKAEFFTEHLSYRQICYQLHQIMKFHKHAMLDIAADRALKSRSVKMYSPDHPAPQQLPKNRLFYFHNKIN
jgi:hypothetical protein